MTSRMVLKVSPVVIFLLMLQVMPNLVLHYPQISPPTRMWQISNGRDYVLDLNMDNLTYDIYKITVSSIVKTAYYTENADANPWQYVSGGTKVNNSSLSLSYTAGLSDAATGLTGGVHNKLSMDLSFLGNTNFTVRNAIGCGNDNIIGKGTVNVPEPTSLSLLESGLLFLTFFLRK